MKVLQTQVFVGPSLYAHFPVIRLTLDLGLLEEWPSGKLGPAFTDALLEALPGLREHGCSYGEPGGFVRRLTEGEGTWMGHVLEHVAIELQNVAGARVSFGKTRETDEPGVYSVVYEYDEAEVGQEAGRVALNLLHHLLPEPLRTRVLADSPPVEGDEEGPFDFAEERDALIRYAERRALGPSTGSLVRAAEERGIPWIRLNRRSLIQFGHGRWQRRIQATVTSDTRHIAVEMASDKELTNRVLADLGLPVPRQITAFTEDEAARAARRLGFPVVVKPLDANHGRGVALDLTDEESVRAAFRAAREHSRTVIVETYLTGFDHRMLVVNGELIAVAKRVPGHVVGDGTHSVAELVEITNRDPRRGIGHEKVLTRLEFDAQAERLLADVGYHRDTVPAQGEVVYLRSTGNISTGGTAIDVTDVVHPDNREMALRAVKAIGLDVGGVDFLTDDIGRSYREIGGGICEVNAAPGFRMHVAPSEGTPRDVAGPVMDMLFPAGTPRRIPIAAVTGTNGKTTTARMLAHMFKMKGHHVGLTTTDGVYIDGVRTVEGDMTGPTAARMVLRDPNVDVAVMETARGGLLRAGMGYRTCDVGAVLNVASDHLGLKGIDTLEDLANVKRIVVEVATDTAVLNADDPHCLRMADHTTARNICYVTMNHGHPLVKEHIRAGGRAMVLEEGINGHMITLYDRGSHVPLLWTHLVPATMEGRALHNVQNAMFAAAMGFSMGLKPEDVRHGLRTFDTTFFQAPGRMNVYDEHPFKVILDYGHNPAAVQAMVDLVQRLRPEGRRIVVLAAPGDRRDEDVRQIASIVAGNFDRYVVRRDDGLRGRGPDEIPAMLRESLLAGGVPDGAIDVIPDEQAAVDAALRMAAPRDLLLVFADAITRTWKQVINFQPDGARPAEERLESLRASPMNVPEMAFAGAGELVRDERGVRLSRDAED
ncbi:MAG: cyanophycin synthetase [Gemmatimonadetes bacterium]|nr:cyanophycin synthetase [Gemmatimonadota bacterium]